MRGLEIINASSGIRPIGQAKSPVGSIAEGLLKAEKGFIATDLAKSKIEASKLKAAAAAKSKYMSGKETALSKLYTTYADDFEKSRKLLGNKYIQANGNETNITNNNAGSIRLIRRS